MRKMKVLRGMISGFKFNLRLEAVRSAVFAPSFKIWKGQVQMPILEFQLNNLAVLASINEAMLNAKVLIKEMKVVDFYKREPEKQSSKFIANSNSIINLHPTDHDGGRMSAQSNFRSGEKGSSAVKGPFNRFVGGAESRC